MQSFKIINYLILGFSFGILIWNILYFTLPTTPTFFETSIKYNNRFFIHLENILFNQKTISNIKNNSLSQLPFELKAIYKNGKKGFIIIKDKDKSVFINLNEKYKNYKLIKIDLKSAIFQKNNKLYKIEFKKIKHFNSHNYISNINRETINYYINNPAKIWNNIGIIKTYKGYKITFIRKGSIFEKLGLKRGDIIIEVNNKRLLNDADAWYFYQHRNELKNIDIVILRNNSKKVLHYEID